MTKWHEGIKQEKHCRFCQKPYTAHIPKDRDGFCSDAHKMALNRAYKKYIKRKNQLLLKTSGIPGS